MRLLLDENFNHHILRGLRLRAPTLDYVIAQRTELQGVEDPTLLEWAAASDRILVTHDISTIPKYAYERVKAGLPMSGVIVVPKTFPIGQAIEELFTIIECSEQDEYENQVMHIPL
jgi:hypothetical protein